MPRTVSPGEFGILRGRGDYGSMRRFFFLPVKIPIFPGLIGWGTPVLNEIAFALPLTGGRSLPPGRVVSPGAPCIGSVSVATLGAVRGVR